MNQSIDTSSNVYLEQSEAEQLLPVLHQNLHDSSLASNANGSIISLLQRETIERKRTLKENVFYPPMVPNSTLTNCCPMDHGNSSLRESMRTLPSPDSQSSAVASPKGDPSLRVLHQAKWARVEDVIKSTAGSPHTNVIDDGEARRHGVVGTRNTNIENEGKQRFPQQQDLDQSRDGTTSRGGRCSCSKNKESQDPREQLQTTQRLLRHNKTKLIQVYDLCASEEAVRREVGQDHSSWDMAFPGTSALHMDPSGEFTRGMEKVKVGQQNIKKIDYVHMRFDREDKHLIDLLKTELSRAINMSVDLVFKNVSRSLFKSPRLQDSNNDSVLSSPPEQSSTEAVSMPWPSYSERAVLQIPEVQTEALSLVIQNPSLGHPSAVNQTLKRTRQFNHQPRCHFKHYNVLEEQQALEHFKYNSPHEILGSFPCRRAATGQSSLEMMEFSWNPIKVRPKINSNYMSHQGHLMAQNHVPLDSLRLPHIKMECRDIQSMVERNSFVPLNEGLTPSHLKKAKLMFFYTRYPSANVLKTFFPDVKFSRCITSQMIKWFSNFREFYYIQMEKFARQAIADGVANVKDLSVGRDSGLFRALNAHYNKANDFQVPDRFLGVVEVTLQEFYIAVSLSKDSDPSWKKSIYKVICKLDSDVPTGFKSSALSHC